MWDALSEALEGTFPTPANLPTEYICRQIRLPNERVWRAMIGELLSRLCLEANWQQTEGGITPLEAATVAGVMYQDYVNSRCEVVGEIKMHALAELPANWLWCNGLTYQRADYPALYAALDPSLIMNADEFQTPQLFGRFPLAAGVPGGTVLDGLQFNDAGGEQNVALTTAQLPAHNHTPANNAHQFVTKLPSAGGLRPATAGSEHWLQPLGGAVTGSTGSNQSHNNMPPYRLVYYAIVAK